MKQVEVKEEKQPMYLTAGKHSSYARKEAIFMSADIQEKEAEIKAPTKTKQQQEQESFEAFVAAYKMREETAKKWEKYLKEELKGKKFDEKRLEDIIKANISPEKWKASHQQPGDVIDLIISHPVEEVEDEWDKLKQEDEKFPEDVIERMREQGLLPSEVEVFGGAYVSVYELSDIKAVWQGVYGKPLSEITPEQKEEIGRKITEGKPPVSAVVESLIVPEELPYEATLDEEATNAVAVAEQILEDAQRSNALIIDEEEKQKLEAEDAQKAVVQAEAIVKEKQEISQEWEDELKEWKEKEGMTAEQQAQARETISTLVEEGVRPEESSQSDSREVVPLEAQVSEQEQETIRHAWTDKRNEIRKKLRELLGEDEQTDSWNERGGDGALDALSKLGVAPDQKRDENDPQASDVLVNAMIPDTDEGIVVRMQQAQKILGEDVLLTAEKEQAILAAHRVGVGETGKFGGEAGIFNLKLGQVREKREILLKAGFSKKQADTLIIHGIAGVAVADPAIFDPSTKTDSRARAFAEMIQRGSRNGGQEVDENTLREAVEIARELDRKSIVDDFKTPDELRAQADEVKRMMMKGLTSTTREGKDIEIRRNLQHYLLDTEMDLLEDADGEGAMEWLNSQFDLIFQGSASGQELDSPVLRATENKVSYAIAYLNYKFENRPEIAERFFNAFTYRQKLMIMRVVIGQRNKESLQGAAQQLRTHGLLSSFGFEDQNVRRMFTRMNEKLEDMRLNKTIGKLEKVVTAEMVRTMQQKLIDEEIALFEKLAEASPYWNLVRGVKPKEGETEEEAMRRAAVNAITRSTRTAYDLFVSSQREALIVARGRYPREDPQSYRSVPSGVFSYFNYEAMMWGGWDMKNIEASMFYDAIKVDIAEESLQEREMSKDALTWAEKLEYGGRRMQELSPIPDFFSSGWRRNVMMQQLEDLMVFKYLSEHTVRVWEQRYAGITKAQIKDLLNEQSISLLHPDGSRKVISKKTDKDLEKELNILREKFAFVRDKKKTDDAEINQAITLGKAKAADFALFMRLHQAGSADELRKPGKARADAKKAWDKIAETKPEEIIRFLKDRLPVRKEGEAPTIRPAHHGGGHGEDHHEEPKVEDNRPWFDELEPLNRRLSEILGLSSQYYDPEHISQESQETAFDFFRNKYGAIITTLRENAMREDIPRALNLSDLKPEEQALVNKAMDDPDAARKLIEAYAAMQRYIAEHKVEDRLTHQDVNITQLMVQDYRFEHLYNKVLSVDDVFMDEIEQPPKVTGLLKVSDKYSTDPAGDGYRRTMNDAMDGIASMGGLYKFITQEKPEAKLEGAQEYAAAIGSANGQEAIAKALRFTYGSYLDMSKPYYWMDALGLKKLPFRIPGSQIERIYGPEAHTFEREELRQMIDRDLRFMLASSAGKKELQDQIAYERGEISAETVALRKESYLHQNEEMLESLKKRIGVTRGDERKMLALQVTLFLIFSMMVAALGAATAVAVEESGGGGGGGGGGGHH